MTDDSLTRERNYFLGGFIALLGCTVLIRLWAQQATVREIREYADTLLLVQLLAKGLFVYLVFRLSRFLNHPAWLTVLCCILAPFSVIYLFSFVGLLIGVYNARSRLRSARIFGEEARPDPE